MFKGNETEFHRFNLWSWLLLLLGKVFNNDHLIFLWIQDKKKWIEKTFFVLSAKTIKNRKCRKAFSTKHRKKSLHLI
jgi:hypothetical protein